MSSRDFKISYTFTVNPSDASNPSQGMVGDSSTIFMFDLERQRYNVGDSSTIFAEITKFDNIGDSSTILASILVLENAGGAGTINTSGLVIPAELLPDLLYMSENGIISTNNLYVLNKAQEDEITLRAKTGQAWTAASLRTDYEDITNPLHFIPERDSGKTFSNGGATSTITLALPASSKIGLRYSFIRKDSFAIRVKPSSGSLIYSGGTLSPGKYLELTTNGAVLSVIFDGTDWIVTNEFGTLVAEP